jgi:hypothetical protein
MVAGLERNAGDNASKRLTRRQIFPLDNRLTQLPEKNEPGFAGQFAQARILEIETRIYAQLRLGFFHGEASKWNLMQTVLTTPRLLCPVQNLPPFHTVAQ